MNVHIGDSRGEAVGQFAFEIQAGLVNARGHEVGLLGVERLEALLERAEGEEVVLLAVALELDVVDRAAVALLDLVVDDADRAPRVREVGRVDQVVLEAGALALDSANGVNRSGWPPMIASTSGMS